MGINNLLSFLKSYLKQSKLSNFQYKTIGIDGHTWLHSALSSIKYTDSKIITEKTIVSHIRNYIKQRLQIMIDLKIKPFFVFDGDDLPIKSINKERSQKRNQAMAICYEAIKNLSKYNKEKEMYAKEKLLSSLDVNTEYAYILFSLLDEYKVKYIVSPYEADAQLSYLYKKKLVDVVMTVDSDLICYDVDEIIFTSQNTLFHDIKYFNRSSFQDGNTNFDLSIFNKTLFIIMCVLSGCDYMKKIKGLGMKTSYIIIKENLNKINKITYDNTNIVNYIINIIDILCPILIFKFKDIVESSFRLEFIKSVITFHSQIVFCPIKNQLTTLCEGKVICDYQSEIDSDIEFLGCMYDSDDKSLSYKVVYGQIDPITKKKYSGKLLSKESMRLVENYNLKMRMMKGESFGYNILDNYYHKKSFVEEVKVKEVINENSNSDKNGYYLKNKICKQSSNEDNNESQESNIKEELLFEDFVCEKNNKSFFKKFRPLNYSIFEKLDFK